MDEIQALSSIIEALEGVEDQDAINRILDYVLNKFGDENTASKPQVRQHQDEDFDDDDSSFGANEIPGVALVSDSGTFKLTVRDPKAKNTNDAAIRLALVTIYAYCQLTKEKTASSKKIVKPVLENWRAYTGNTRNALAQHAGILRDGDALSLDHHATLEAEQILHDIKDPNIIGKWQPNGKKSRTSKTPSKT